MLLLTRIRRWFTASPKPGTPLPEPESGIVNAYGDRPTWTLTGALIQYKRQKEAPNHAWDYPQVLAEQEACIAHLRTQLEEAAVDAREIRNLRWQLGDVQWRLTVAQNMLAERQQAEVQPINEEQRRREALKAAQQQHADA